MSEDAEFILIIMFWALLAYTLYLNFWVVRRMRKKLDRITEAALSTGPAIPAQLAAPPVDHGELRRIQDRLQVLERIAVEKENGLSREIESLRSASA